MSAIIVGPHIDASGVTVAPENFMPLATRMKVAGELNALWAEFVKEMHDGPTVGTNVAEKFWAYVTR
jgi:hypothetical protein